MRTPEKLGQAARTTVSPPLNLLHIVKNYGPVGGMERYVWELTQQLAAMGHTVCILCEQLQATAPANIRIIQLGETKSQRRWIKHLIFSHKVSAWVAKHPDASRIIHSHERSGVHQFTTFHGPPFAAVKSKPLWQRFSPRIYANLWLEKRELCNPNLKAVIPNSTLISDALLHYYPEIGNHLAQAITPGVSSIPPRPARTVPDNGGVIGFVGKEWKRKGLDIAVKIVAMLRQQRPALKFIVAGPEPDEIRHLFKHWNGGFELLGETDSTPLYAQFDLLLHPARQEPYGMVIAEARAAAVAVLVSDACGIASELNDDEILNVNASIKDWSQACHAHIGQGDSIIVRPWQTVAREQLDCYRQFLVR